MNSKTFGSIQRLFTVDTYVDRGLTLVRGDEVYLSDVEGNQYLDLMSNYGVNIFGYDHPQIKTALNKQVNRLTTLHGSFNNNVRALSAKNLVKRCGRNLTKVFLTNSGSEAIEAALKFAVLATKKKTFVVAKDGYHGKTLGALSATYGKKYKQAFTPLLWNFKDVEFGNIKKLEKVLQLNKGKLAGVLLEPIQGEAGIYPPASDYLNKVRQLCDKYKVLLILDEIQTGCGRTGTFLASHKNEIDYDIVCLGKGLGAGIPVGATLVNQQIADKIPKHIHTSTFGANPLACAGVQVTLNLLDEKMLKHVQKISQYFVQQLEQIKSKKIVEVRSSGLMIGMEMKTDRDQILKKLQTKKILAIPAGENVVRFLPPYIITKKHVDETITVLTQILKR